MSTVLLMSDVWQPTVLQLAPFASNNARPNDKRTSRRQYHSRGFPVLAVTRSSTTGVCSAGSTPRCTSGRSLTSLHSMDLASLKSTDVSETDTKSEISVFTPYLQTNPYIVGKSIDTATTESVRSSRKINDYRKYIKKLFPDSHSQYKEAMTFSVQDINDQTSSASSLKSTESVSEGTFPKNGVLDNTRTRLPKPSMCPSPESKMYSPSPSNGVRRFVPLTPGELDLKRYRDKNAMDQARKKKKYKLNINELPRSNTPINDHDPDKLNMKQVIAFLQTNASRDAHHKEMDEKRAIYDKLTKSKNPPKSAEVSSKTQTRKTSEKLNAKQPRIKSENRTRTSAVDTAEGRVTVDDSVSVLSMQTTPDLPYPGRSVTSQNSKSVPSGSSNSTRSAVKQKPKKEFKLHRFLSFASEAEVHELDSSPAVTKLLIQTPPHFLSSNKATLSPSPKRYLHRKPRNTTTANLLHRRAVAQKSTPQTADTDDDAESSPIRLPSMTDNQPADDGDASDTDSVSTSATFNSTKVSSNKDEIPKYSRKDNVLPAAGEKSLKQPENKTRSEHAHATNDLAVNSGFPILVPRVYKTQEFPQVNISGPNKNRQIHVDVPKENKNGYSQEIVRLTLRQEKNTTRVTSYMSDMMRSPISTNGETDSNMEDGETTSAQKPPLMNNYVSYHDNQTWYESPRQLINSISNKTNFVKVRQKLESNVYNHE